MTPFAMTSRVRRMVFVGSDNTDDATTTYSLWWWWIITIKIWGRWGGRSGVRVYKDLPLLILLLFLLLILISSHPAIPSHPIPAHLISSHAIPHPITSHPIPSHPIPPHSPFPSGTQFRKINNFLEAFSDPLVYGYHIHLCSEEVFFATSKKCVQKIPYRTWDAASSGTRLCKDTE